MVYKTVVIWNAPSRDRIAEFERHYAEVHVPLTARVPGLRRLITTRIDDVRGGTPDQAYRIAEMWFDGREEFDHGMASPEYRRAADDGTYMRETFGVTLFGGRGEAIDAVIGIDSYVENAAGREQEK